MEPRSPPLVSCAWWGKLYPPLIGSTTSRTYQHEAVATTAARPNERGCESVHASSCVCLSYNISTVSFALLLSSDTRARTFCCLSASALSPLFSPSHSLFLCVPVLCTLIRSTYYACTRTRLHVPPSRSPGDPRRRSHPPPPSRSNPTDLTKAREEKNHAAEQHVCCIRADRQVRWFIVNRCSLSSPSPLRESRRVDSRCKVSRPRSAEPVLIGDRG